MFKLKSNSRGDCEYRNFCSQLRPRNRPLSVLDLLSFLYDPEHGTAAVEIGLLYLESGL
jgi:hypothetical protein